MRRVAACRVALAGDGCNTAPMARIWSFFTGAGGLDLGMESVGLKPELAVEIDPTCCETLATNRSQLRVLQTDVTRLGIADLRDIGGHDDVDLVIGGPPCQSFST